MKPSLNSLISSNWLREGETVVITRHGKPVAELVPAVRKGVFPFGIASKDPIVSSEDDWWQPLVAANG